ncbi:hypothetical protein HPB49_010241 [Dermacentor silvarum]|uniref:Uncharacterized protein n=1 Tax=Dermacentor silvarum TaxID=543639 RepID=A0ACB8D4N5_DERSI|nr:hypothetical protein HPB49_010241 [Dermacentor silvarum]
MTVDLYDWKRTSIEVKRDERKDEAGPHMPVVDREIKGRRVSVLRDSDTNTVLVRRSLMDDAEFTGEQTLVVLADGTTRGLPEARVFVSTPYYTGLVTATIRSRFLKILSLKALDEARARTYNHQKVGPPQNNLLDHRATSENL